MMFFMDFAEIVKKLNFMVGCSKHLIDFGFFKLPFRIEYSNRRTPLIYDVKFYPEPGTKNRFKTIYPHIREIMRLTPGVESEFEYSVFKKEFFKNLRKALKKLSKKGVKADIKNAE